MLINGKKNLISGILCLIIFVLWTALILTVDVQAVGVNGTKIGLATLNTWFHDLTGVNMRLYVITDWLGLIPVFVCIFFGMVGFLELLKRKSVLRVDPDILLLGIYYVTVISAYIIFEMFPLNFRPVLIDGVMEASYPSSTVLLVLSIMPTLVFQSNRRIESSGIKITVIVLSVIFSVFMVVGRLLSGVHWVTDIVGSCFLSAGLFNVYKFLVFKKLGEVYGIQ